MKTFGTAGLVKFLLPLGILGIAGLAVATLHATAPEPEQEDQVTAAVTLFVEPVRQEDLTLSVRSQGEVRPRTEIELVAQVAGRVASIAPGFAEGGIVDDETVLVSIEDADYELAVIQAEARVAEAALRLHKEEANAEVARRQWERLQDDVEPTPLALKAPQVAEARAQLRATEADVSRAKLDLARTKIQVPFSGRVLTKSVDIGQYVSVGTSLGRVFSTEIVEVKLPLTDAQFSALDIPIAYAATDGDGPEVILSAKIGGRVHKWQGTIVRTDAAIDRQTGVIFAFAEVKQPYDLATQAGQPLAVGQFVTAEIVGRDIRSGQVIPRTALRSGNTVFVVNQDNVLEQRVVTISYAENDRIILTDGLRTGEQVVVSPLRNTPVGTVVRPLTRSADQRIADLDAGNGVTP